MLLSRLEYLPMNNRLRAAVERTGLTVVGWREQWGWMAWCAAQKPTSA